MRRFPGLSLALLLAPLLAGCGDLLAVQGGLVAHPASTHSAYVESFNDVLDDQIEEPLSTPLLTGYDVAGVLYGFLGLGITRMEGSSEATFTNGTVQRLDLEARDTYFRLALPVYAMGAVDSTPSGGFPAPLSLQVETDIIMRKSLVGITQTPTAGDPTELAFGSTDVVFRPTLTGVVRGSAFMPGPVAQNVALRAGIGYDLPIATDGFDASLAGFLAREYTAEGSTTFTGEEQQPGFRGFTARVSLAIGF